MDPRADIAAARESFFGLIGIFWNKRRTNDSRVPTGFDNLGLADGGLSMADDTNLETATDEAVAACDGDARAAVRALLVVLGATEDEIATLKAEGAVAGES